MRRTAQLPAMVSGFRRPLHSLSPPWLDGCPRADQTWAKKMGNFYLSALGKPLGSSREMMDKGGSLCGSRHFGFSARELLKCPSLKK